MNTCILVQRNRYNILYVKYITYISYVISELNTLCFTKIKCSSESNHCMNSCSSFSNCIQKYSEADPNDHHCRTLWYHQQINYNPVPLNQIYINNLKNKIAIGRHPNPEAPHRILIMSH